MQGCLGEILEDARRGLREQDLGVPVDQREEAEKILWAVPQSDRAAVGRLAQVAHDGLAEGKEDAVVNRRDRSIHVAPAGRPEESNLLDWGKTFLPDHFLKAPSEMHQWMADELDRMTTEGRGLWAHHALRASGTCHPIDQRISERPNPDYSPAADFATTSILQTRRVSEAPNQNSMLNPKCDA